VPEFVHTCHRPAIAEFAERVPPPWILKPRGEAGAIGIRKIERHEDLWPALDELGDRMPYFLLEHFIPGDIFHVDALTSEREVVFAVASKYGRPPFEIAHAGGIFTTRTLPRDSGDAQTLLALNRAVIASLGLVRGATHTEFIRAHEHGRFYFLETASRVGGAHIAELVEMATGVNLWAEWARLDILNGQEVYHLPEHRDDCAGLLMSLAKQEWPDMSAYDDPEVVWRVNKRYHAGLIVTSQSEERVTELMDSYSHRFYQDFFHTLPAPETLR
jgi:hypothetical protein